MMSNEIPVIGREFLFSRSKRRTTNACVFFDQVFEKLELDFIFVPATIVLATFLAIHILPYLLIFRERLVSGPGVSANWRIRVETRKQKI